MFLVFVIEYKILGIILGRWSAVRSSVLIVQEINEGMKDRLQPVKSSTLLTKREWWNSEVFNNIS